MTETTREDGRRAALLAALDTDIPPEHLLTLALTHRSYAYEHGGLPTNERLEFLGDSVLGVVITERLYLRFPDRPPEGELAKIRASVVNMHALADVARGLGDEGGLGKYLYLGRGEEMTGGRDKDSILADGSNRCSAQCFSVTGWRPRSGSSCDSSTNASRRPGNSARGGWTGRPRCRS